MKSLAAIAALLSPTLVRAATPDEWKAQSIYSMLTDRFARTDNSTTAPCDTTAGKYCGGTWRGIINNLDYIQDMGFTAIWITPVTAQWDDDVDAADATSYHGYWQKDLYSLNSKFGTADDLKALADALHARGMLLMVDVVANHFGYGGSHSEVDYSIFNPLNSQDYFHPFCLIEDYDNQEEVEQCWLADTPTTLPDVDTTNPQVRTFFNDWIKSLVANYSIDGLRVDTVKHVEKDFWPDFNEAAGVYAVGEVFNGDPAYTCPYQEVLDGVLNYPIYYPALDAFKSVGGNLGGLAQAITTVQESCKDSNLLGNFLENHDIARFASYTDDLALAKNGLAFIILSDGIPIIYAGQEQHYAGDHDPTNREAVWLSGYNTDAELYQFIKKANGIRNLAISQNPEFTSSKTKVIYQDDSTLAINRGGVVTVLSNEGASGGDRTVSIPGTGFEAGTELTDVISCKTVTAGDSGAVDVPLSGGLPSVLYPSSQLAKSGLCASA